VSKTGDQGVALVDAVEAVLRPLLPLFRSYDVSHLELSQALARLVVYDTAEVLEREGHPTTPARLALMTGLTRGEVQKHLTEHKASVDRHSQKTAQMLMPSTVLTIWNTNARFSTPYGAALDLSLDRNAQPRNFHDLVSTVSPDADAETVLDQLLAAGCVEIVGNFVRCTNRAYIPVGVSTERIARFRAILSAFAATGVRNLLLEDPQQGGYVERAVQSDFPVSEEGKAIVKRWLTTEGVQFLEQLDAFINASRDQIATPAGQYIGVDIFMYDVPEATISTSHLEAAVNL
jgi:hypothetical protein